MFVSFCQQTPQGKPWEQYLSHERNRTTLSERV